MTSTTSETVSKAALVNLQTLLKQLLQFNEAGLDFGVYRIINYKRSAIRRFINDHLPDVVNKSLSIGHLPETRSCVDSETLVYNHLYRFFSRYCSDSGLVSKRSCCSNRRCVSAYDRNELCFHWDNSDQYYITTSDRFRTYVWNTLNGITVIFRTCNYGMEEYNTRSGRRFFLPDVPEIEYVSDSRTLIIPFECRSLTMKEKALYGRSKQQEKIICAMVDNIQTTNVLPSDVMSELTVVNTENFEGKSISSLEYHLRTFTSRNEVDVFIHRNLHRFFEQELDHYLKNELLDLDNWAELDFQIICSVKKASSQIIKLLSQIECFKKTLWEKRKFVTNLGYCVTLASIDKSFYQDIISNNQQWQEWCLLYGFKNEDRNETFCGDHPTLMLDTQHFDDAFTDRLLSFYDNIDDITDGLIIKSDNWQALNMISNKYHKKIQCVYIDPPYNTAVKDLIYQNKYKHSSWLTLMKDRIMLSQNIIDDEGVMIAAIDDTELAGFSQLLDTYFTNWDRNTVIVNHHPAGSGLAGANVSRTHEYALFMTPSGKNVLAGSPKKDRTSVIGFTRTGTAENNLRAGRPNSFYAVLVDPDSSTVVDVEPPPESDIYPLDDNRDGLIRIYPIGRDGTERVWRRSYKNAVKALQKGEIICKNNKTIYLVTDQTGKRRPLFSNWTGKQFNAGVHGSVLLKDLFGKSNVFSYPKSVHTVRVCIDSCTYNSPNAIVLDYFAGSGTTGHAVIKLNREDGGKRKFVLVEMGNYFDTVLVPRIKKVVYTPEWKNGLPCRSATEEETRRSPRIIKYLTLESYEDSLDNILFDRKPGQQQLGFGSYDKSSIQYMIDWETSRVMLLNTDKMTKPFSYNLSGSSDVKNIKQTIDLPETFNWLLGLTVSTRRVYHNKGKRYLVYHGATRNNQGCNVTVIWRETDGWVQDDYTADRQFIETNGITDRTDKVYINGGSCFPDYEPIEPVFKKLMFASLPATTETD